MSLDYKEIIDKNFNTEVNLYKITEDTSLLVKYTKDCCHSCLFWEGKSIFYNEVLCTWISIYLWCLNSPDNICDSYYWGDNIQNFTLPDNSDWTDDFEDNSDNNWI